MNQAKENRVWKFAAGRALVARPTTTKYLFKFTKLQNVEREEGGTENVAGLRLDSKPSRDETKIEFCVENRVPIISRFACDIEAIIKFRTTSPTTNSSMTSTSS
jgi:hypothetical protein